MVLHMRSTGTFAKLISISALAAVLPLQPGKSVLVKRSEPSLITGVRCGQGGWPRAMGWLTSNSLSIETIPDFGNDVFGFKVAKGILKNFPVKIMLRMRIWKATGACAIEVEQYSHAQNAGFSSDKMIWYAEIFADFKTYMEKAFDSDKQP
jgi:hypothetical protein